MRIEIAVASTKNKQADTARYRTRIAMLEAEIRALRETLGEAYDEKKHAEKKKNKVDIEEYTQSIVAIKRKLDSKKQRLEEVQQQAKLARERAQKTKK